VSKTNFIGGSYALKNDAAQISINPVIDDTPADRLLNGNDGLFKRYFVIALVQQLQPVQRGASVSLARFSARLNECVAQPSSSNAKLAWTVGVRTTKAVPRAMARFHQHNAETSNTASLDRQRNLPENKLRNCPADFNG
jgi:hypothetical protein